MPSTEIEKMIEECLQYETSDISCGCQWWHYHCEDNGGLCKHQIFHIFKKLPPKEEPLSSDTEYDSEYETTKDSCTCPEFTQGKGKPCQHMRTITNDKNSIILKKISK